MKKSFRIISFLTVLLVSCTGVNQAIKDNNVNVSASASVSPKVDSNINISTQKKVSLVEIFSTNAYFDLNKEGNMTGLVKYSDGSTSNKLIWFSSDSKIATIDETGKLKALSPGKVKITATSVEDVSITETTEVTVNSIGSIPTPTPSKTPVPDPKGISRIIVYSGDGHFINDTSVDKGYKYNIPVNSKGELIAKVIFNDGSVTLDVNWQIYNPDKIRMENGIVYAMNKGEAYVYISSKQDPKKTLSVTFNIYDPNDPCIAPPKEQYTEYEYWTLTGPHPGYLINTSDIKERTAFNGKVYDLNEVPVDGAKVTAQVIDPCVTWKGEDQITIGGAYVFRNVPVGAKIQITASKGGIIVTRTEVLKSNPTLESGINRFDFIGIYSVPVPPEITSIKINNGPVDGPGTIVKPTQSNLSLIGTGLTLTYVDNTNLTIEIAFSEPVDKNSFEDSFRMTSQLFNFNNNHGTIIDKTTPGVTFKWSSDRKYVKFETNNAILANTNGSEAKYMIDFSKPFKDDDNQEAVFGKYFNLNNKMNTDFIVFSVRNNTEDPKLLRIYSYNGIHTKMGYISLIFNEPFDLINYQSSVLKLADPAEPLNISKQIWSYETQNVGGNNATLLGYNTNEGFKAVYMIGKLVPPITANSKLQSLFGTVNSVSSKNTQIITSAEIHSNQVLLYLPLTGLNKGDILIVSVGKKIEGNYIDKTNNINIPLTTNELAGVGRWAEITDPAGRFFSTGEATTFVNIDVNNSQRVAITE